jgi:hypothetical protein
MTALQTSFKSVSSTITAPDPPSYVLAIDDKEGHLQWLKVKYPDIDKLHFQAQYIPGFRPEVRKAARKIFESRPSILFLDLKLHDTGSWRDVVTVLRFLNKKSLRDQYGHAALGGSDVILWTKQKHMLQLLKYCKRGKNRRDLISKLLFKAGARHVVLCSKKDELPPLPLDPTALARQELNIWDPTSGFIGLRKLNIEAFMARH